MPMTVVVTRNVEPRVRGFLASTMLEIASGVYTAPKLSPAVRERIWEVLQKWCGQGRDDGVVMTWQEGEAPGGQAVRTIGEQALELRETPSVVLTRRELTEDELRSLTRMLEEVPF